MYNPNVMNAGAYGMPQPQGGNFPMTPGNPGVVPPGGSGVMPPGPHAMPDGSMMGGMGAGMPGASPGVVGPGQLDPAMVQQILALQSQQGGRNQVGRQVALANQLRADAGQQLRGPRTGLANVGASVLGTLAAKQQMNQAGERESALDAERTKAMGNYFNLIQGLRGAGGGAAM